MYQKCPRCNGAGFFEIIPFGSLTPRVDACPICNGESIIHQESGLPPTKHRVLVVESPRKEHKNPEGGELCIFWGKDECKAIIAILKAATTMPHGYQSHHGNWYSNCVPFESFDQYKNLIKE